MSLVIVGRYNHYGYVVESADGQQQFHRAGNCRMDSVTIEPLESHARVSLRELRLWCRQVVNEIAKERRAVYGDIERIPDELECL